MHRISPLKLEVVIVKSSGTDVEKPAIFPTVLAFKFKFSANFRKYITKIYLDTITINPEYKINFPISIYNFVSPTLSIYILYKKSYYSNTITILFTFFLKLC